MRRVSVTSLPSSTTEVPALPSVSGCVVGCQPRGWSSSTFATNGSCSTQVRPASPTSPQAEDNSAHRRNGRASEGWDVVVFRFPGTNSGFGDGADGFGFDGVPVAEWAGPVEVAGSVWVLGDGPAGEGLQQMAYLVEAAQVVMRGVPAVGERGGVIDLAGVRGAVAARHHTPTIT